MIQGRRFFLVGAAAWLLLAALPQATSAADICCICSPKERPADATCVTGGATDCADLAKNSSNKTLNSANCKETLLSPNECRPKEQGGLCLFGPVSSAGFSGGNLNAAPVRQIIAPILFAPFPGLQFATELKETEGKIQIPFLAQYISAFYRYITGLAVVAAAIMIVYGGFLYIVGNVAPKIQRGKQIILDAVIGLVLILGAYTVLNTINPELLSLQALKVKAIEPVHEEIEVIPTSVYRKILSQSQPSEEKKKEEAPPPGEEKKKEEKAPEEKKEAPPPGEEKKKEEKAPEEKKEAPPLGKCDFEINQAGMETVESIYKCAVEVIAKETGVDPCYLVVGINHESFFAVPASIGHDENAITTPQFSNPDNPPPVRKQFVKNGTLYSGGTFSRPISDPKQQHNDDKFDPSKPDLGLDKRYSHGGGLMQFTVSEICGKKYNKAQLIHPYTGVKAGAEYIKCNLDRIQRTEYQQYPGTIAAIWNLWGGCYDKTDPKTGKTTNNCANFLAKDSMILPAPSPKGRTRPTYECIKLGKPMLSINKTFFTICRGDLPLDREACREYVKTNLKDYELNPNMVCNTYCADKRFPVQCSSKDKVCRLREEKG